MLSQKMYKSDGELDTDLVAKTCLLYSDKVYASPISKLFDHDNPRDAFADFHDGTRVEDTTIYAMCEAARFEYARARVSQGGRLLIATVKSLVDGSLFRARRKISDLSDGTIKNRGQSVVIEDRREFLSVFSPTHQIRVHVRTLCSRHGVREARAMKVLYIGKGNGSTYSDGSLDRSLGGHKQLPRAMNMVRHGHEVCLVLMRIDPNILYRKLNLDAPNDLINDTDWYTELFEASLINYFKPPLNKNHVSDSTFPSKGIVEKINNANLDFLICDIDTSDTDVDMYSDRAELSSIHLVTTFSRKPTSEEDQPELRAYIRKNGEEWPLLRQIVL